MIFLVPRLGLANRLRVMASALSFAESINHKLTIVWKKDSAVNCEFTDLFELNDRFTVRNYAFLDWMVDKALNEPKLQQVLNWIFSIDFSLLDRDINEYVWSTGGNFIDFNKIPIKPRNILISTCHEFHFVEKQLKYFHPIHEIQSRIDKYTMNFCSRTIGIHIRRTDHIEAIEKSPLHLFIHAMNMELVRDSSTCFYLATDSRDVEKILTEIFAGRMIIRQRELSRLTKVGMQDAMIDLFCLAKTSKIYGSYYSSFSEMAARIGNISLEFVMTEN